MPSSHAQYLTLLGGIHSIEFVPRFPTQAGVMTERADDAWSPYPTGWFRVAYSDELPSGPIGGYRQWAKRFYESASPPVLDATACAPVPA